MKGQDFYQPLSTFILASFKKFCLGSIQADTLYDKKSAEKFFNKTIL